jgi:plastocyanin
LALPRPLPKKYRDTLNRVLLSPGPRSAEHSGDQTKGIPMTLLKSKHLFLSVAAAAVVLGGCGGGNDATSAPSSSATKASANGGGAQTIDISDFKFVPKTLTVSAGSKITVKNSDSTAHTATADSGGAFNTGDIQPGASAAITLKAAGRVAYHCNIHPFMHGTIVVR